MSAEQNTLRNGAYEKCGGVNTLAWSYEEAFERNRGLINEKEQEKLRRSRVAIAGMGGVGGVHLMTLARLGIGKFTIADPDVFEVANFNRQHGATFSNCGRNKAAVMAELALDVNPQLDLRVIQTGVNTANVDEFLNDSDVYVDGLDFFAIDVRRLVFQRAAANGIWAVTAAPLGFGVAWLVFDPVGMSFDEYFDINDDLDTLAKLVAFGVGLAPKATHRNYLDFKKIDVKQCRGPSASLACQMASGIAAAETLKILLQRGTIRSVPSYGQFDAYAQRTIRGRLGRGNRSLCQRIKRAWLIKRLTAKSNY
jgi:molybdopterin/thiamine biosynthesis adenylyltransferase